MQFDENGRINMPENSCTIHTLSYDEKPGIQAVAGKYPDHNPTAENGYARRDYEYVRKGTLSLLAGIDLLTGFYYSMYWTIILSSWYNVHTK